MAEGQDMKTESAVAGFFDRSSFFAILLLLLILAICLFVVAAPHPVDILDLQEGQTVRFSVDAFPNDIFNGTVRQIRLVPTVTSNVVTYTVIIDAPNDDGRLYPGMTANITIVTKQQQGLIIPLEATQYSIDPATEAMAAKEGYTIQRNEGEQQAFVLEGKKLVQQPLTLGIDDGANVIVESGIDAGDKVVLSISRERLSKDKEEEGGFHMGPPERKRRE